MLFCAPLPSALRIANTHPTTASTAPSDSPARTLGATCTPLPLSVPRVSHSPSPPPPL
jgi:hypothetical protein